MLLASNESRHASCNGAPLTLLICPPFILRRCRASLRLALTLLKKTNIIIFACSALSHYKRVADITNVFVYQYQNQFLGGNWSKNLVSNKDRTSRSRSRDFCFCFKVLELDKPARLIIRLLFGFDKLNESTSSEMECLMLSTWN